MTVLDELNRINQIATYKPYAEDSTQRIREIVRSAIEQVKIDNAIAAMMLEALQDVLNIVPNGIECNCGDTCDGTCTRAKVLAAIAKAKGETTP